MRNGLAVGFGVGSGSSGCATSATTTTPSQRIELGDVEHAERAVAGLQQLEDGLGDGGHRLDGVIVAGARAVSAIRNRALTLGTR